MISFSLDRFVVGAFGLALLLAFTGCGGGSGMVTLSGEVKYDGQSVDLGTIRFEPTDGRGSVSEFPISAGRYSGELTPGKKRVIIQGKRQDGVTHPGGPTGPAIPSYKDFVPEKYNSASQLDYDVTVSKTDANFLLVK